MLRCQPRDAIDHRLDRPDDKVVHVAAEEESHHTEEQRDVQRREHACITTWGYGLGTQGGRLYRIGLQPGHTEWVAACCDGGLPPRGERGAHRRWRGPYCRSPARSIAWR
eukprot:scaffold26354_cov72-Phaeocystis_antarctica.AAC.4